MRNLTVFALRWIVPGLLAFGFLALPSLVRNDEPGTVASSWFVRIFFALFLSNPFLGAAKVPDRPNALRADLEKYASTDKDTLVFLVTLGDIVLILGTIFFMFYGLGVFFPELGIWRYLITSLYGLAVGVPIYYINRMKIEILRNGQS